MKRPLIMRCLLAASLLVAAALVAAESKQPIRGTKCAPNQVINRLTVYENGAIEAECGPLPCGSSGYKCTDGIVACRSDNDIFNGMSWAPNGQSVLLRCCGLNVPKKIYVGTDLVTAGSFYVGGAISEKDKYGSGGAEYDFITNIRTEQGGVRVWVYRVMCDAPGAHASVAAAPRPAAAAPVQQPVQQQPRPAPAAVPAAPAETDASRQEAFEARRRYLLERLSGQQKQQQAAQSEEIEEQGDEEGEYEDEEETPTASTFNPLRYRPAVRGNKAPRV